MASHGQVLRLHQGRCKPETAFQVAARCLQVGSEPDFRILGTCAVSPRLDCQRYVRFLSPTTSRATGSAG